MGNGRNQDDALAIRDRRCRKTADGPIEKLLILIELYDMIARPRVLRTDWPLGVIGRLFRISIAGSSGSMRKRPST